MTEVQGVPLNKSSPEREKLVREAKLADELLNALAPGKEPLTKRGLVEYGLTYWPHTYAHTDNDVEAAHQLDQWVDTRPEEERFFLSQVLKMPDQTIAITGASRWQDQGRPVIRLGHRRAAAFMATSSSGILDYVKAPFQAFYVEMPTGLLPLLDHDDTYKDTQGILVQCAYFEHFTINGVPQPPGLRWNWMAMTGDKLIQWQLNRTLHEMLSEDDQNDWQGIGIPLKQYDARVSLLVGRLICGICLSMSDTEEAKLWQVKTETLRPKGAKKAPRGAPTFRVLIDKNLIDFDARPAVAEYLRGQRNSAGIVQVGRYYRAQHYGPGNMQTKIIRVEAHKRGMGAFRK